MPHEIDIRFYLMREIHSLLEDIQADEVVYDYESIQNSVALLKITVAQYELQNEKLLKRLQSLQ